MSASTSNLAVTGPIVPGDFAPLFWPSLRSSHASAWHGHVSFAHWIVVELRPAIVVELGTHNGVSFAAFCNAASKAKLRTQCYAIDSWEGDEQAGTYGEEVYDDIKRFSIEHFPNNAVLLRTYFDAAVGRFAPKSIDLLHIDGLHTYEAVLTDFQTWLPKLSDRAVILFHDINVQSAGFGVWRLWAELSLNYPHFRFNHSSGLGIIAVGSEIAPSLAELFSLEREPAGEVVRTTFETASQTALEVGMAIRKVEVEHYLSTIAAGRVNLALTRPTLQSSVEPGTTPTAFGAVDGNKTGRYGFHTAFEDRPWWIVDLGSKEAIDEIVVYNRLDDGCRHRSNSLDVSLADDERNWRSIFRHTGAAFGGIDGQPLRVKLPGDHARYVRLALCEPPFLHIDKVEVFSTSRPE